MKNSESFEETVKKVPFATLNIGGGKEYPLFKDKLPPGSLIVNLDSRYISSSDIEDVISRHETLIDDPEEVKFTTRKLKASYRIDTPPTRVYYVNKNISKFLLQYYYKFDIICMYNFLERVPSEKLFNFFNLIYSNLKYDGYLDIIVSNFEEISSALKKYRIDASKSIKAYTKLFGTKYIPHRSVWTPDKISELFMFFRIQEFKGTKDRNFNYRVVGLKGKAGQSMNFFEKTTTGE